MSLPPGDLEGLVASPIAMEGASVLTATLTATSEALRGQGGAGAGYG